MSDFREQLEAVYRGVKGDWKGEDVLHDTIVLCLESEEEYDGDMVGFFTDKHRIACGLKRRVDDRNQRNEMLVARVYDNVVADEVTPLQTLVVSDEYRSCVMDSIDRAILDQWDRTDVALAIDLGVNRKTVARRRGEMARKYVERSNV